MTRAWNGLVVASLLLASGCGTLTQGGMVSGPAAMGGVRLDASILGSSQVPPGSKAMAALDLLPSLAFDLAFLPISLVNEAFSGGIDVEEPVNWDNPPPKYAPYSAPPSQKLLEARLEEEKEEDGEGGEGGPKS